VIATSGNLIVLVAPEQLIAPVPARQRVCSAFTVVGHIMRLVRGKDRVVAAAGVDASHTHQLHFPEVQHVVLRVPQHLPPIRVQLFQVPVSVGRQELVEANVSIAVGVHDRVESVAADQQIVFRPVVTDVKLVVAAARIDLVCALAAIDDVVIAASGNLIVLVTTEQLIAPVSAHQRVLPAFTVVGHIMRLIRGKDRVVAAAGVDASHTHQLHIPEVQHVVLRVPQHLPPIRIQLLQVPVSVGRQELVEPHVTVGIRVYDRIESIAADQQIVFRPVVTDTNLVVAAARIDRVCALAAIDDVVIATSGNLIVLVTPEQLIAPVSARQRVCSAFTVVGHIMRLVRGKDRVVAAAGEDAS
jgi:hypothetical protein